MNFLIILVLILVILYLLYRIWRLISTIEKLEETILNREDIILKVLDQLNITAKKFKEIDYRGYFSTDDEVGSGFKALINALDSLQESVDEILKD